MFIWIVIIIAIISVVFSFLSLRNINARSEVKNIKKDLAKNRVLYQDSSKSREE